MKAFIFKVLYDFITFSIIALTFIFYIIELIMRIILIIPYYLVHNKMISLIPTHHTDLGDVWFRSRTSYIMYKIGSKWLN